MFKKLGLKKLNRLMTLADKITVVIIIFISVSLIFLTPQIVANKGSGEKEVVVTLDNEEIYRYPLADNQDLKRIKFDFTVKGENYRGVLRMKEGKVKLERLSKEISPLPIHSEMGWISKPYQMILCMPIKLAVKIEEKGSSDSESEIDVRTY